MASGIVALLDSDHNAQVQAIWEEFKRHFGVHGVSITPIPHFSFHVAESYDALGVEEAIAPLLNEHPPLTIRTAGLGLFTGSLPVLHIPVVRDEALTHLQTKLWDVLTPLAMGVQTYYHPHHWLPHITLAQGDLAPQQFSQAIEWLQNRDFNWMLQVHSLALLQDSGSSQVHRIARQYQFNG